MVPKRAVCARKWRRRKNGDGDGWFVPVSDDDEDSGDDANGDGEGRFVPLSGDDAKMVTVKGNLCP